MPLHDVKLCVPVPALQSDGGDHPLFQLEPEAPGAFRVPAGLSGL